MEHASGEAPLAASRSPGKGIKGSRRQGKMGRCACGNLRGAIENQQPPHKGMKVRLVRAQEATFCHFRSLLPAGGLRNYLPINPLRIRQKSAGFSKNAKNAFRSTTSLRAHRP